MKVIIDGNNVCHIVNHTMGHLSNDERKTGVIFGFMKQMLQLSKRMKTNEFIFCWDSRKSFRKQICPTYKSNRKNNGSSEKEELAQNLYDQISELRNEIIPALGFKNNYIKTGYEADDLIAYTVLTHKDDDYTIVSTDHDLYQLLDDNARIFNTITKKFFTKIDFMDQFKIDPLMFREIKAISGCTSDFIEGIVGVGESTAAKYVRNEPISTSLLDRIHQGQEIIALNRKLTYLPFNPNEHGSFPNIGITVKKDQLKLYNFKSKFNELSFNSFLENIDDWKRNFKL